eukprot:4410651-Lingulodinium_polyedra.AAC.1
MAGNDTERVAQSIAEHYAIGGIEYARGNDEQFAQSTIEHHAIAGSRLYNLPLSTLRPARPITQSTARSRSYNF